MPREASIFRKHFAFIWEVWTKSFPTKSKKGIFFLHGVILLAVKVGAKVKDICFREAAVEYRAIIVEIINYRDSEGDTSHTVYINYSIHYSANGQNPYLVYCSYKDDNKDIIYQFKTHYIWTNPNLIFYPGDAIQVYVDEKDYSCYYVDVENVLKGRVVDYT
jgi:hypothetical protein